MNPVINAVTPYLKKLGRSGDHWWKASCPFHEDRKPSFAINEKNGYWVCHSCHQKGSLQSLLRQLGLNRKTVEAILNPLQIHLEDVERREKRKFDLRFRTDPFRGDFILPESILGAYDWTPTELIDEGFDRQLLESYDIGFDHRNGRITFPIRDLYSNLIGISGRSVYGDEPKYKIYHAGYQGAHGWVPSDFGPNFDEEREFQGYKIEKSRVLWNGDRALPASFEAPPDSPLVVVEGFKACLWVIQSGFPLCVALLGSSASIYQIDLLRRVGNPIVIFLDANNAGLRGTRKLAKALSSSHEVRIVTYPLAAGDGAQPDTLTRNAVTRAISSARRAKNEPVFKSSENSSTQPNWRNS